jgi:hypothetical protein
MFAHLLPADRQNGAATVSDRPGANRFDSRQTVGQRRVEDVEGAQLDLLIFA